MTKAEICKQLREEFKQVEEFKAEHDEIFDGIVAQGVGHIKFAIQRVRGDLKFVLENLYVDRELLERRKKLAEGVELLKKTSNFINSKDMVEMNRLDKEEIQPQINKKEYYFKRIKIDDKAS